MKQEIFLSASCFLAEFFLLKHTLKETEVTTYFLNKIADLSNFLLASLVKNRLQPSWVTFSRPHRIWSFHVVVL